ncbi:MAG: ATP-dependent RNA helicase HrpA, partial [Thermoguttaceae bacterium]|nr:ATP-dependent RNA helicase HrpA [Thermoguttaceae bacterium]
YVLDPGTARISRYSTRSRTQRLPIEPVSQASANQRSGRCGRVGPGICIRLYSEDDFKARPEYTTPEIQRTNLATVILQTKILNLGAVECFPFIDPPRPAAIADGYRTLFELGAIDSERNLTELGKKLSRLPVDPRIGRMILAANEENCLREMLIIASVLEIQDPRERPHDQQEKADQKHLSFLDEESDFLAYLKIWDFWQELKDKLSSSQLRKACRENFLSFNRMREWSDIHLQLLQIVHQEKMRLRPRQENNYDAIHRAILTGLLYGIARKTDDSTDYKVTGDTRFSVWPGSGLFHKKTEWLVASERVETSRRYLRTVARINPDWIESLAAHLLERTFREPHWIRETGCVHAYERVSLYGLTIIPKRRINYGPVNPKEARDLFIQQALVEDEFDCDLDFFVKNRELRQEAKRLQDKLRRHDFLHGQSAIREFYQDRIPEDVYDAVSLKKWYKRLSGVEKQKLCMRLSDICQGDIDETTKKLFPDKIPTFEGTDIPLEYRFHPGEEDDGLAAVVPAEGLRQLEEKRLGWLVPGLMEQKIVALLKTLPKEIRRELVPIPDTAAEMVRDIPYGEGGMEEVVAREVSRRVGRLVTASDFDLERLPSELLMKIKVIDGRGKLVAESRELPKLREKLGIEVSRTLATAHSPKWNRDGLTRWDFGSLPESVVLTRNDVKLRAYPALCDPRMLPEFQEDSPTRLNAGQVKSLHETVSLRLLDSPELAQKTSRYGILRLFYLSAKRDFLSQADWLPNRERYQMYTAQIPGFSFRTACGELIAARALDIENSPFPKNEGDFNRLVAKGKSQIGSAVSDVTHWITQFAQQFQQARLVIEKHRKGTIGEVARDAEVGLF